MTGLQDDGAGLIAGWCADAFGEASVLAGRLPSAVAGVQGACLERGLALRMCVLAQKAPPYRALRALRPLVSDGWADRMAGQYTTHAKLTPAFQEKAVDLRPTGRGWIDTAPERRATGAGDGGPMEDVLADLVGRVRRYVSKYSTIGVIGRAETGLARICLMLARFEAGLLPEAGMSVEEIHRSVPEDDVRDLVGLVRKLNGAPGVLPKRTGRALGVAEPVFVRGAAEGDLILDGTLIAVCLGDRAEVARRLQRLVAHAWLDVYDLYRVDKVGVYLAGAGALVSWPVLELAERLLSRPGSRTARTEFQMMARTEITEPRPVAVDATRTLPPGFKPDSELNRALPLGTVYGAETWDTVAGAEWIYWDLWMSVVVVVDYGGDWDALDASWYKNRYGDTEGAERFWSHLVDLKARLAEAGISAAELIGDLARHQKTLKKARSKVVDRTGVTSKHYSPAMRDVPSERYERRAHFGRWDRYPVTPRGYYRELAAATPFDLEAPGWGLPTFGNVDPLFEALEELEAECADDTPSLLAVRRAGLTAGSLAAHRCNDSHGDLGDHIREVLQRFSCTDWRSTGIDPAVFWRDILEILTVLDNFGLVYEDRDQLMANLGAARDRDLIERIVGELRASYVANRLNWAAGEVVKLLESF